MAVPAEGQMPKIVFRQSVNARVNTVKCSVDGMTCFTIESKDNSKSWTYFGAYRGDHLTSGDITMPLAMAKDVIRKFVDTHAPQAAQGSKR